MADQPQKKPIKQIINKSKWWDILSRFIDVLRINMFMVDTHGKIILPPEEGKYGGQLIINQKYQYGLEHGKAELLDSFFPQGHSLEFEGNYEIFSYALPIEFDENKPVAYLIVGPLALTRKLKRDEYDAEAARLGVDQEQLWNVISEIRVVSHVMINSILDLLKEIIKDTAALNKRENSVVKTSNLGYKDEISKELEEVADEIYSTVRLDELLGSLLDVAIKITNAESGSIMVLDQDKSALSLRVSRGLNFENFSGVPTKLGEGIAGMAALENTPFIIEGNKGDSRISHLLNREEISKSVVMPLELNNQVFGVLNVSSKNAQEPLQSNIDNLQYLSKLISAVI